MAKIEYINVAIADTICAAAFYRGEERAEENSAKLFLYRRRIH